MKVTRVLEFLQIKYFLDVVKYGSVSEAARANTIPQPSLSQSIRRLENEIGVPLFDRRKKKIELNEYGRIFEEAASASLLTLNNAVQRIRDMNAQADYTFSLCIAANRRNVLRCLYAYLKEHPQLKIRLFSWTNTSVLPDYDVIIAANEALKSACEYRTLLNEPLVLAVPPARPLAQYGSVRLRELENEDFILPDQAVSGLHDITVDAFKRAGISPNISAVCSGFDYVQGMLDLNIGVALVPRYSWGLHLKNVKLLTVTDPPVGREVNVYWQRDRYLSKPVREFIEAIEQFFSDLSGQSRSDQSVGS